MPIGGKLKLLKGVLYRLKRGYGCPLAVYRQSPQQLDLTTGRACVTRESIEVKRAMVLPSTIHRDIKQSIGYLKANSNFTYGGVFTDAHRIVIIDRKDLPGWTLDASDQFYIVYQNQRWELKEVSEFEFGLAYYLTLSRVDGAIVNKIHTEHVRHRLEFFERFEGGSPEMEYLTCIDNLTFTQQVDLQFIRDRRVQQTLTFTEHLEIP